MKRLLALFYAIPLCCLLVKIVQLTAVLTAVSAIFRRNRQIVSKRPKYPTNLKKGLIEEAGNKCANPGCSNHLTELHHIREWRIYKSHDQKHMIAVCPSCHDSITRGNLKIDDETLYRWKGIIRATRKSYHIYAEPNTPCKVLLGSLAIQTPSKMIIFELSNKNAIQFEIINKEILLIDSIIRSLEGEILFEMYKNHIKSQESDGIKIEHRPGKFRLTVDRSLKLIPTWTISQHLLHDQEYFSSQKHTLVDIEVIEPGLIRVSGIWLDQDQAVVISPRGVSFITKTRQAPLTLCGEGKESTLLYMGPINKSLFTFI